MNHGIDALLGRTRAVLFDFDGPICSVFAGLPAPAIASKLRRYLIDRGSAVELAGDASNDPLEVLRVAAGIGGSVVREIDDLLTAAETRAIEVAAPTAGAEESIQACRQSGRAVGIVSNNSAAAVSAYLDRHQLACLVDGPVVGRAHAQPHLMKPDPHPMRLALDSLGVPGEAVLLVGDSTTDVLAARAAGVNCIGFANRPGKQKQLAGADIVIGDMRVLADALSRVPLAAET